MTTKTAIFNSHGLRAAFSALLAGLALTLMALPAMAQMDPSLFQGMKARNIGPAAMSGRLTDIDVVQRDANIIYIGTATGGVWKSVDAGLTWEPIFDDQPVASIGAVAVNQTNPAIVWVGSGEGNTRNSTSIGNGIYKSMDGGRTWQHMGLAATERINRIALHPTNPDIAYVAALGELWEETEERGVYKTTDGGETWQRILYVNDTTGATDIKMDPENPHKLFAAMWQFHREPYRFDSGGEGSGLYVSHDSGATWHEYTAEDGLPEGPLGRAVFTISPQDPDRVYALVEAEKSALLRSDDGGESWQKVNTETNIAVRPFYYTELLVDPQDPDTVYNVESNVSVSLDAGKTFDQIDTISCCAPGPTIHIDVHTMWINPADSRHMMVGNDGGLAISHDKGATWRYVENLPLAQFYHIRVDEETPYNVYGGLQDNGSWRGPAEVWDNAGIRNAHWQEVFFGDGFDTVPDPEDAMAGYAMSQGGSLAYYNIRTGETRFIKPVSPDPENTELRFNWNAGIALDPFDPATVYYGSQFVHKSTDRGQSWDVISPDLTTDNPDWQSFRESGGLTSDVTAAENYTTIVAIAPSPVQEGVIWVGTDDGRVHVTRDGGETWESVEDRARGVPDNSWVPFIEPSPHDPATAFVIMDNHRRGDMTPYAFRVENYGRDWEGITTDDVSGYALSVRQDLVDPNLLFLGTEFGLFVSTNGGDDWMKWTAGVPTVSVMDLAIQARETDLVLGTHGRGVFVIDDYSALRGLQADDFEAEGLTLLSVTPGQQYNVGQTPSSRFGGSTLFQGENEPYGALITLLANGDGLPHPDEEQERARKAAEQEAAGDDEGNGEDGPPKPEATVEIADAAGTVIRIFTADLHQGVNRIVWNLRRDGAEPVKPPEDGILPSGAEVAPGTYTATVSWGDHEVSGNVEVLADPRIDVDTTALEAKSRALLAWRDMVSTMNRAIRTLNEAEEAVNTLKGIADKRKKAMDGDLADDHPLAVFISNAEEAGQAVSDLLDTFRTPPDTKGIVDNSFRVSQGVFSANFYLSGTYGAPTPVAREALAEARRRLNEGLAQVNDLMAETVQPLKAQAGELELSPVPEFEPFEPVEE